MEEKCGENLEKNISSFSAGYAIANASSSDSMRKKR